MKANAEKVWDAIVIGTGVGGATVGYALARAGCQVLFCERGRSHLTGSHSIEGKWAEEAVGIHDDGRVLRRSGRWDQPMVDLSGSRPRSFTPVIGSGTGGSSALAGMAMERLFPVDFEPRTAHRHAPGTSLPEAWPITYDHMSPHYEAAERLYGVRGGPDPLRQAQGFAYGPPPPMHPRSEQLRTELEGRGLHPYRLPVASAASGGCTGCQGHLCAKRCKRDSARACLEPAVLEHGATVLDECMVVRLETRGRRVSNVHCVVKGERRTLRAKAVVLAAGALATPALLLASSSADWPHGLANASGQVGRNMMRHYLDLHALRDVGTDLLGVGKELATNDLYRTPEGKWGTVQSFGPLPPLAVVAKELLGQLPLRGPELGHLVSRVFRERWDVLRNRLMVFASICEDLPYEHNRVHLLGTDPSTGAPRIGIHYRLDDSERARLERFRRRVRELLAPHKPWLMAQAESNDRIAHVCGTCRMGADPRTSVVDAHNRVHDLDNLFVVDASFFPSSGGTNPALTIAANGLRVADEVTACAA